MWTYSNRQDLYQIHTSREPAFNPVFFSGVRVVSVLCCFVLFVFVLCLVPTFPCVMGKHFYIIRKHIILRRGGRVRWVHKVRLFLPLFTDSFLQKSAV
jgi:hypothetical protein